MYLLIKKLNTSETSVKELFSSAKEFVHQQKLNLLDFFLSLSFSLSLHVCVRACVRARARVYVCMCKNSHKIARDISLAESHEVNLDSSRASVGLTHDLRMEHDLGTYERDVRRQFHE